jgi:hypothetical protein
MCTKQGPGWGHTRHGALPHCQLVAVPSTPRFQWNSAAKCKLPVAMSRWCLHLHLQHLQL